MYLVVLKGLVNGDDIVCLVVPGHAAHQADGQLVVLTVELELLLMLLTHIGHQPRRPVSYGGSQAAHAGSGLPLLGLFRSSRRVPALHPRGRAAHHPGSAHTVHHVAEQRVGSEFAGAGLPTLGAAGQRLLRLGLPALDDAQLAEVVAAVQDDRVAEELQAHRARQLRLQLLKRAGLGHRQQEEEYEEQ